MTHLTPTTAAWHTIGRPRIRPTLGSGSRCSHPPARCARELVAVKQPAARVSSARVDAAPRVAPRVAARRSAAVRSGALCVRAGLAAQRWQREATERLGLRPAAGTPRSAAAAAAAATWRPSVEAAILARARHGVWPTSRWFLRESADRSERRSAPACFAPGSTARGQSYHAACEWVVLPTRRRRGTGREKRTRNRVPIHGSWSRAGNDKDGAARPLSPCRSRPDRVFAPRRGGLGKSHGKSAKSI